MGASSHQGCGLDAGFGLGSRASVLEAGWMSVIEACLIDGPIHESLVQGLLHHVSATGRGFKLLESPHIDGRVTSTTGEHTVGNIEQSWLSATGTAVITPTRPLQMFSLCARPGNPNHSSFKSCPSPGARSSPYPFTPSGFPRPRH